MTPPLASIKPFHVEGIIGPVVSAVESRLGLALEIIRPTGEIEHFEIRGPFWWPVK